ncbi:sugar phosphate isomerase/epimerase [bacterium]|nr:sugar phosphate isomerase/epimerase [bacterium]
MESLIYTATLAQICVMRLSLSVRIAEGFLSKEEPTMPLDGVCSLAVEAGYEAICMRASQIGVQSAPDDVREAQRILSEHDMPVSMLTGDFPTVYNNERGPDSLREIRPYLDLAEALSTQRIRVALKHSDDIPFAQRSADEAAERGLTLLHQCHHLSLFETVDGMVETLNAIDRPNFRLIYEPANMEQCGQAYGLESVKRLGPWIDNVYFQNQRIHEGGAISLDSWTCGPVAFDLLQIHEAGGIDFPAVFEGLRSIGYDGTITVHQSAPESGDALRSARATADYLRQLMAS